MNGILFNHESPRRGPTFVTRKITRAVAKIARDKQKTVYLGNLDAKRDWGHARDYIEGMWMMLQAESPEDFVLATNVTTPIRTFVEKAFNVIGESRNVIAGIVFDINSIYVLQALRLNGSASLDRWTRSASTRRTNQEC